MTYPRFKFGNDCTSQITAKGIENIKPTLINKNTVGTKNLCHVCSFIISLSLRLLISQVVII